jgi:hypothetical protein
VGRRGGFSAYLAFVGPAVVASIAYMDPSNFAADIVRGTSPQDYVRSQVPAWPTGPETAWR